MIQKRYQFQGKSGIEWTEWFDFCEDNSKLDFFQKEEKYQLRPKLLNEYKI